jgi:hypothetical protein
VNKPLCKITLKDLLDSVQNNNFEQTKPGPHPAKAKHESINDWLTLDEIAEDLNISPDLLYACMEQWNNQDVPISRSGYMHSIQMKQ